MSGKSSVSSLDSKQPAVTIVQQTSIPTQNYDGTSGVLAGGGSLEFYEPIPEYEGRHRYDPLAEWTEKEEKQLVRRVIKTLPRILRLWIKRLTFNQNIARLQDMFLGLSYVLRPSAGSRKHRTSIIRRNA